MPKILVVLIPQGKSLIGKAFQTKAGSVCVGYCGHDKKYMFSGWEDRSILTNPGSMLYELEITSPIDFEITHMRKQTGIGGTFIDVGVEILHDIDPKSVRKIRECIEEAAGWIDRSNGDLDSVVSPMLDLGTEDKIFTFYSWDFGINFCYNYFDTSVPCVIPDTLLRQIE